MPVRLDLVPKLSYRPPKPRMLIWLLILLLFVILGGGGVVFYVASDISNRPFIFWFYAIGVPLAFWCVCFGIRWSIYLGQNIFADGWDERYQDVIARETQRGRRSLQILKSAVYTAFDSDEDCQGTFKSLVSNERAIKSQPTWHSENPIRHSHLPRNRTDLPNDVIEKVLSSIAIELIDTISSQPNRTSLSLYVDSSTPLEKDNVQRMFVQKLVENDVRSDILFVGGDSLWVIDNWLDNKIKDDSLLIVVSIQVSPDEPELTAESAIGLIFANRLSQKITTPIAYLHRPECFSESEIEKGMAQAMDWVPVKAESISQMWLAGLSQEENISIAQAMETAKLLVDQNKSVYDIDAMLGNPKCVAPWLALAAAAQAAQESADYQMTLSNTSELSKEIWCAVVAPYKDRQEIEV